MIASLPWLMILATAHTITGARMRAAVGLTARVAHAVAGATARAAARP